jgi:hypothetical protein
LGHQQGGAMLFMVKSTYAFNIKPQLSRVWIKTGNPRMPLRSFWIDEGKLHDHTAKAFVSACESDTQEHAEDHLILAA